MSECVVMGLGGNGIAECSYKFGTNGQPNQQIYSIGNNWVSSAPASLSIKDSSKPDGLGFANDYITILLITGGIDPGSDPNRDYHEKAFIIMTESEKEYTFKLTKEIDGVYQNVTFAVKRPSANPNYSITYLNFRVVSNHTNQYLTFYEYMNIYTPSKY